MMNAASEKAKLVLQELLTYSPGYMVAIMSMQWTPALSMSMFP